jgi:hypothetical protein
VTREDDRRLTLGRRQVAGGRWQAAANEVSGFEKGEISTLYSLNSFSSSLSI